ncbi:MAG: decarboxylating 6-phosphogluconate dehydrogenase [Alphaproteobacteria bacterium]|nr:decarboxylating 6-phosphogluconate dehydrogenase [Alphaproteobacteria bacterium]
MEIGMVGLGRMGANMTRRLLRHGHSCVVYDRNPEPGRQLANEGAVTVTDLPALVRALQPPRIVWLMLPAGEITEAAIRALTVHLVPGDTIVDGGNTFWKDDIRRAGEIASKGLHYVDVGTSGGVWGLDRGYCLMIGGDTAAVDRLDPLLKALSPGIGEVGKTPGRPDADPRPEHGYVHAGPIGAGHFVKMVHNGIEYGLMQAYAEGFEILKHARLLEPRTGLSRDLNLADIAEVWRRGSVIPSWILDLTAVALAADPQLEEFTGHVSDSGEGRWVIGAAIEEAVPVPVLSAALYARFRSRQGNTFADKMLSAMRKAFGGHEEAIKT